MGGPERRVLYAACLARFARCAGNQPARRLTTCPTHGQKLERALDAVVSDHELGGILRGALRHVTTGALEDRAIMLSGVTAAADHAVSGGSVRESVGRVAGGAGELGGGGLIAA